MKNGTAYMIADATNCCFKQSCACSIDELRDAEMVEFVREDLADSIAYCARRTGENLDCLLDAVNGAADIPAMFAAIDAAIGGRENYVDTCGLTLAA